MERLTGRKSLGEANRVVVKIGSRLLCGTRGKMNLKRMKALVEDMKLVGQGRELLLVTSGAIGAGVGRLGLSRRPRTLPEKQAAAAVGQGVLMQHYESLFAPRVVAQVLLTREDINHRQRFLNARHTLTTLLALGVIPIVNENDTVAVEEIRFGDNDHLAALVASLINADLLILLSDIDGFYTGDPHHEQSAKLISEIDEITPELERVAGGHGSPLSTGGMETKLAAGRITMAAGIPMVIAGGLREGSVPQIMAGQPVGTLFKPRQDRLQARKHWIAFGSPVRGAVTVDEGAAAALLEAGKSLLPSGIVSVDGDFEAGNVIGVVDLRGEEIARGVSNYSAEEVSAIKGRQCREIKKVLGCRDYDEVIHRDNLTLISRR